MSLLLREYFHRMIGQSLTGASSLPPGRCLPLLLLAGAYMVAGRAQAADTAAAATQQVLEHHGNAARSGVYVVPELTWEAAGHLQHDPQFHAEVAGPVYSQPLYWRSPENDRALLLVATEQNLVYALDARTGATLWKSSLGPPVPRSSLPCGNIDPVGVTGTPAIDDHTQAVYLDAMTKAKASGVPRHMIFALSLKDGSVLPGWPMDVEAALQASGRTFHSPAQNQRG